MPGGDRTGPRQEGPMTGRGFGYCRGWDSPGSGYMRTFAGPFSGRGLGFGRGRGRGMGLGRRSGFGFGWAAPAYPYGAHHPISKENEADLLRQEAKHLEDTLAGINQRLTQLEEQNRTDINDKK
jgi:hypothetical protein